MAPSTMPGPWVNPELVEDEPWLTNSGIVKFFEFPVRIPEMSRRAFHLYWQRHHSPNVMNVTGFAQFIRKYNSSHIVESHPVKFPPDYDQSHPFEGAAEVWLNSLREVSDWLSHPLYEELIQPDEPRFIAQDGRSAILITKEERLYEPNVDMIENGKIKVYLLFGRKTDVGRNLFHQTLSNHAQEILGEDQLKSKLLKLVVSHRLNETNLELPDTDIDAVLELWFESLEIASAFFAEPIYQHFSKDWEASFADTDKIRTFIAIMRVVHDEFSFQPSTTQPLHFNWPNSTRL